MIKVDSEKSSKVDFTAFIKITSRRPFDSSHGEKLSPKSNSC